jgi:phosphoglycerol transferase MdoB-like AlkP superfamily enzyme
MGYNLMHHPCRSVPARLAFLACGLFLALSTLSRLALLIAARHEVTCDATISGVFATGIWYDAAAAVFAALPWLLLGAIVPQRALTSRTGKILVAGLMTCFAACLIFVTTAEWFFWEEFGARFNFIAVDYLLWTQEVMKNIFQSYPMVPILAGIVALAGILVWLMHRSGILTWAVTGSATWQARCTWVGGWCALAALAAQFVSQGAIPAFTNQYHGELAKNGCWSFFAAARQMEFDYDKWYLTLPKDQALAEAKQLLASPNETAASKAIDDLHRHISGHPTENRWNIILVCMESMGEDFMSYPGNQSGNQSGITPNLDRLTTEAVFCANLYATGTRTVRGMEALTLSLPPTPGQSIIYRPEGTNLTTTFTPFLQRGYDCAFFYGGNGRFDYMNRYFATSGCRIMDVNAWQHKDVTFKTSWGACDEDMLNKTIAEADANHSAGKPFNFFCMTTSNHRPFDFPAGRIDLPSHSGRNAAVKYADWAIGNFLEQARQRPWFKDTLFIFVADHCASSAGKTEIDVTKYHVPAMLYNPLLVPAKKITALCSQVDVMPTVFGLLNWNYDTLSYGHDLLAPSAASLPGRAFVSNYQKIALLTDAGIAILKPNRKSSAAACNMQTGEYFPLDSAMSATLVHDATVFYQSAYWLFHTGRLKQHFGEQPR